MTKTFFTYVVDVVACKIIVRCRRRVMSRAAIFFDGRSTKAGKFFFKFHM